MTITIEQDRRLREIAERTGRKISELAREAVEEKTQEHRFLLTLPKIYVKWNYVFQINRTSKR